MEEMRKKIKDLGGKLRKCRGSNFHAYVSIPNANGGLVNLGCLNINTLDAILFTDYPAYVEWRLNMGFI